MTPDTSTSPIAPIDWQRVERTVGELGSACQEMERFCAEVFDDLGTLTGAVAARAEYLSQAAAEADIAGGEQPGSEETERLVRGLCEEVTGRWEKLYGAQQAASAQLEEVAGLGGQLTAVCEQLHTLGHQVAALEQQVREPAEAPDESDRKGQLEKQLAELARRHEALRHERAELETELEAVRVRAAELSEDLREQKQRTTQLETEWSAELRRMRRALEMSLWESTEGAPAAGRVRSQSGSTTQSGSSAGGRPGAEAGEKTDEVSDPVLDSVMAQFELIQRDMARRRAKQ